MISVANRKDRIPTTVRARRALLAACFLAGAVPAAHAQGFGVQTLGGHLGARLDPDQVVLGAHADFWQSGESVRLRGVGSLGFGEDTTILDLRPELHYVATSAPLSGGVLFYTGAGIDLANIWLAGDNDGGYSDFGLIVLGGLERRLESGTAIFGELNVRIDERDQWFVLEVGMTAPF
jgi:hypothetical protein